MMTKVVLKPGKEKSVLHRHPWIFAPAIARTEDKIVAGNLVEVLDSREQFLAYGYYNHHSQIRIRLLEWDQSGVVDNSWWEEKIVAAIDRRKQLISSGTSDAVRLIYAEADLIPGLIVDQYGDYLVLQSLTAGIELRKEMIVEILNRVCNPKGIFERSDSDVRVLEGLSLKTGLLSGEMPESLILAENGIKYSVNLHAGQKTGFFIDQRDNRLSVSKWTSGKEVLDCFSYSGGFSLHALKNGATSVTTVDSSESALNLYRKNLEINDFSVSNDYIIEADVFKLLRQYRDEGRKFDVVILDPPKLAPTHIHLEKALLAYKDMSLLAMKILRKEGILAVFSCSGGVSLSDFRKANGWAAKDAGREVQIIQTLSHAEDHPILVSYPESEYLKGLICRVI